MSSIGTTRLTTPLLPWRPAILSPGLQLPLHRDEDLDHLHHAGRQLVAALQLVDLALEALLQALDGGVELALQRLDLDHRRVVLHGDLAPGGLGELLQHAVVDDRAGLDALEAAAGLAVQQPLAQAP
jgi:hypothetical protein